MTSLLKEILRPKAGLRMTSISILVFIACLCVGFEIARHRPLWNDENYSQIASIHCLSYADQFSGRIPEGGNSPLFYSLQKLLSQLNQSQIPAQILLRINPVIFMSLSVGLVFYYFYRRYSLGAGLLSLFIYLSSHMLWVFWAEARPYALLVFLTTVQSVILLNRIDPNLRVDERREGVLLAGTNILLSLTSILSLGEILAVSVLWWAFKDRDWKKYIFMTLLPMAIILFYYAHAPKYPFYFGSSRPGDLFHDNISKQCFYVFYFFLLILSVHFLFIKTKMTRFLPSTDILKPVPYVLFMVLVLASSAFLLCFFALHAKPGQGFPVTSRYLIYLTPIGVIATTILTVSFYKSWPRHHPVRGVVLGIVGILLAQHFLKTMHYDMLPIVKGWSHA